MGGNNKMTDYTAKEKIQIVFEGQGKSTITEVCKKYNISRQTYYDWKEDIENSAAEFFDNVQPGRKRENEVKSMTEAKEKIKELEAKKKQLEEEALQAKKQAAIEELQKDYLKFCLTEDDIDPELKKKNRELLKKNKNVIHPDLRDGF